MVMDATQPQPPSPQSVGREFVRQYYTLLNRAPNHLHRFYTNNSSFVHGESPLVVGQRNIHNYIQQLNFHDCHAKISQVDAQATLGNGVVVQVTGELSNDGQPMRRFTQTFVLAAQTPKKYYVHNDIFRYQDLYSDEENDGESRSENDEEHEQTAAAAAGSGDQQQAQVTGAVAATVEQQQQLPAQVVPAGPGVLPQQPAQAGTPQQPAIYYSVPAAGGAPVPVLATPQGAPVPLGAQFTTAPAGGVPPQQVQAAAVTQLNGVVAHDDLLSAGAQPQSGSSQQPLVAQGPRANRLPILPPGAGAELLAAQPPAGVAVPVASATGLAQTPAAVIPGFQQSPLMQQQILQQQQAVPQPNQQQQQPTILQSQTPQPVNVESEENSSSVTANLSSTNSDTGRNTTTAASVVSGAAATNASSSEPVPVDDFKTINEQQQQEKYEAAKQQQNEPKTYANLFKSTSSSPSGFVTAAIQQQQQLQQQQQQQQQSSNNSYQSNATISSTTFSASNSNSSISAYNNRNNENSSLRMDNNNISSQGGPLPQRSNTSRINKDFDQRRTSNSQQTDNQQLFLGNIPHHASEEELKALFARFGTVLELRILSKTGGKVPPGMRNPQNFGFITYEDAESVQNCLSNCPLYFPENSPDGQKLNVEEKKPRLMRPNDMPPRQSMGNSMSNNNMSSSQRNMSGGPPSRSLSNSGGGSGSGMMRGSNSNSNSMSRGSSGPRIGGAFNRNENRGGPSNGGGPQVRGGNNNAQPGGGSYSGRR